MFLRDHVTKRRFERKTVCHWAKDLIGCDGPLFLSESNQNFITTSLIGVVLKEARTQSCSLDSCNVNCLPPMCTKAYCMWQVNLGAETARLGCAITHISLNWRDIEMTIAMALHTFCPISGNMTPVVHEWCRRCASQTVMQPHVPVFSPCSPS
jgi:hypothetical protein